MKITRESRLRRLCKHFWEAGETSIKQIFFPSCAMSLSFCFWTKWIVRPLGVTGSPTVNQNVCESNHREKLICKMQVLFMTVQHYLLSDCVGCDQGLEQLGSGIARSVKQSLHWKYQLWRMPEVPWRSTKLFGGWLEHMTYESRERRVCSA